LKSKAPVRVDAADNRIANLSVLAAAAGVKVFEASWPDILVGAAISALFLRSAFAVIRESVGELGILSHSPQGVSHK